MLAWLINFSKSSLGPNQQTIYVGVEYQLGEDLALAPMNRLQVLEHDLMVILLMCQVTARQWASVIGQMDSLM